MTEGEVEAKNIIIVYCDGRKYVAEPFGLSVTNGRATISVKGQIPISVEVREVDCK